MLRRMNCDSTPPISPSSTFQGGSGQIFNDQHGVLNMSPRPSNSSYSLSPVKLGKILHDQTSVWSESEMTPRFRSFSSDGTPNAKSSVELVEEITSIEIEILHLERYLLSLYRTSFEQHLHSTETNATPSLCKVESHLLPVESSNKVKADAWLSGYQCKVSPLQQQEGISDQTGSSIPKSSPRRERRSGNRSLGDHLGTPCSDGGPDRLSEDIVRCISSIYCKLGDPNQGPSDSSASSLSSSTTVSTRNLSDTWSPYCNVETTQDSKYDSLKKDERGPYADMIEVLKIGLDDDGFNYAEKMLKHFRTLIKKLEKIDPGKMKREQKLAFWINLHNALVMHAHLAYGTHNNTRTNSILKATYNVGGQFINAYIIQSSILGIRSHFRASWLQSLLSPGRKLTTVPTQHVYAIEYPEPLVHFALSLGAFSDPAVRVYKANNVFKDLRVAKQEFIRSTVYIHKESKIYVPKILYYFAKDMELTVPGLLEMVNACLPESQQKGIKRNVKGKPDKYICWLSQSCIFRYVIHRDAIDGRLPV
ncbi:hypothetical protein L6452_07959 [Arctium lappa]|uniref:Uncharacterized protein n=1 Tax=Arctium lappa TaxID=4217 RepID=A0ACB9DFY6_ARCLA|nr:hypothetical protein L6452_07959 [Arctium lappa]